MDVGTSTESKTEWQEALLNQLKKDSDADKEKPTLTWRMVAMYAFAVGFATFIVCKTLASIYGWWGAESMIGPGGRLEGKMGVMGFTSIAIGSVLLFFDIMVTRGIPLICTWFSKAACLCIVVLGCIFVATGFN